MNKQIQNILKDERGAGFTEYLILVGLIAIICITAFTDFGKAVSDKATDFSGKIGQLGN
jgi:Flp pilus assembly pilin Flp